MTQLLDASLKGDDRYYDFLFDTNGQSRAEFVEMLWQRYVPYADPGFREKIAREFHAHFWEMYLGVSLLEEGLKLCPKSKSAGPDIAVVDGGQIQHVEAVVATEGTENNRVPSYDEASRVPVEDVILRYRNSLEEKHRKYERYVEKGTIGASEPYIVAINGGNVPFNLQEDAPNILRAVAAIGNYVAQIDPRNGTVVGGGFERRENIVNANGSSVPTTVFEDEKYKGISGIVFSHCSINSPPELGHISYVIHNPLAVNRLPCGWLKLGTEIEAEDGVWKSRIWNEEA